MAAFSGGAAKFTGGIRACLATGGPGAPPPIKGLYDAKLDHTHRYWRFVERAAEILNAGNKIARFSGSFDFRLARKSARNRHFPESEPFDCASPHREVDQQGRYIACSGFPLRK